MIDQYYTQIISNQIGDNKYIIMMDIAGVITFSNFLFVLAIAMIVMAIIWLFGLYFVVIIASIPVVVIELILYATLSLCVWSAPGLFGNFAYIWGMLFAWGLSATTLLTGYRTNNDNTTLFYLINMFIHGVAGAHLQSSMICFSSVMFFMALIGFKFGFGVGYVVIGYDENDIIPSATLASLVVTFMGCFLKLNPISKIASLFVPGALWLGPLVFYVSLLILSSKYYPDKYNTQAYVNMNVITVIAGLCAVFFGNVYDISQLYGFGGTFFTIFLLEKYIELMPNIYEVYAWSTLALGIALYMANMYFRTELENSGLDKYFHLLPAIE